ncbi:hypothetical protein J437_LFUL017989 [Ladona fulva]|uniref:C2H2-type domain-containing protein n=1 Tax=Ladona fulva TaxID=123851 RepID=A0A8K0PAR2_LADFU|nr:hypothetical protein J437_LFUL017989 [Ladona fulva]
MTVFVLSRKGKVSSTFRRLSSKAKMADEVFNPQTLDLRNCRLCFENEKILINLFEANGSLNDVARAIRDVLNYEVNWNSSADSRRRSSRGPPVVHNPGKSHRGDETRTKADHSSDRPLKCPHCDYRTSLKRYLRIHSRKHTGEKPYKCNNCEYSTCHYMEMKLHFTKHKGEKPLACAVCGFCTAKESELKKHVSRHRFRRPFDCVACQFGADRGQDLAKHVFETHARDRLHNCRVCGFSSNVGFEYRIHMRRHDCPRPFKCDSCGFSAAEIKSLTEHYERHATDGILTCDSCGYVTKVDSNMRAHVLRHQENDTVM